jgi:trehalose/maltose hydrolase-like predicted phosphorylase
VTPWALAYDGFDPPSERLREALCTLGNGYFATRGAAPEAAAGPVHYPGTYVAGCYDRLTSRVAGREVENEDLVNVPNWLPLTFRPEGGDWLDLAKAQVLGYRQELDLRRGVLTRFLRVSDAAGRRTRVTQRRFVSMDDPHLAGLETTVVPEGWSGRLEVRSGVDGRVTNAGVERYRGLDGRHLLPLEGGQDGDDRVPTWDAPPVRVAVGGQVAELAPSSTWEFPLEVPSDPGRSAHDRPPPARDPGPSGRHGAVR